MARSITELNITTDPDARWYMILDGAEPTFITVRVVRAPESTHKAGYVNIDKDFWRRAPEGFALQNDITFEGIAAEWLEFPRKVRSQVPFQFNDYWIGCDWMSSVPKMPDDDFVLGYMMAMLDRLNAAVNSPV